MLKNTTATNPLKDKLARHEPIMGIWSIIPSAPLIEVLACAGFDFLILDMEHGAFGFETLENCIRACESSASAAIVRPPGADLFSIQKALDLGAHGILIPQIANFKTAVNAVGMTKFAPDGNRGFNPFTRAAKYCPPPIIPLANLITVMVFLALLLKHPVLTKSCHKFLPYLCLIGYI
jgi:4-hydroxy-2-oxoheptanedioate aldolase